MKLNLEKMKKLENKEEEKAIILLNLASEVAKESHCRRRRCGALIIRNGKVLGNGFNSQPLNSHRITEDGEIYCRKTEELQELKNFKSDKTCCVHAEQRAILNVLFKSHETESYRTIQDLFRDTIIIYSAIDSKGNRISSDEIYCTICSKLALDVGISKWILWHNESVFGEEGVYVYNSLEYNNISYKNNKKKG